jgi:acyl-CoA hydrolase
MQFDASLRDHWTRSEAGWSFEMPEGWGQGRALYGGLTAAAAVSLAQRQLDDSWQLRTFNAQFLRPSSAGQVSGELSIHRQGKGTTFAETRLSQNGNDFLIVNQVFVRPRESEIAIGGECVADVQAVESLPDLPFIPGVTPEFIKHVQLRWASGGPPFTGSKDARFFGYCRFREPFGDIEGMVGLLDLWPCPTLTVLRTPAAASSVMWTAHILEVPSDCNGWFGFDYETVAGAGGLHTAVGRLYAPDGRLVGWTEQLVTIFA